jgi:single-strand DNA-binding protein
MLNQCCFIGRLGKDPEVRHSQSGDAVASFSVACTESWKKDGEKQEKTAWVNCVAWRKLGEICGEYLQKGSLVYVSGSMQTRKWDDKDGVTRYTTEIVLKEMKMLGGKRDNQESNDPQPGPDMGDDCPF